MTLQLFFFNNQPCARLQLISILDVVVTLVKVSKAESDASFPQFLALNGAEPASHQKSHRTIIFRDQLALPLLTIAAKPHGRSMS